MLNRIIQFSINNKLISFLLTITIAAFGIYALSKIPLGAVPDITNNQVQVITTSKNLSTQDVEQFITYPVELEMSNLPGVKEIRSISKFGLSVVTIVFEENMGAYLPRQLIAEKIKSASENIPEGFGAPEMGPISTGLGEIYQYVLDTKPEYKDQYTTMELRTIQDWVVKRQLSGIPGVVEVNTWGGLLKQYEVAVDPEKLKGFDITLIDVYNALSKNNSVAGGAYIEKQNETYFIRGDGLVNNLDDIRSVVIRNINDIPLLVKDVASVEYGSANRFGAITANGEGEKVMGQIMMLKDANSNKVIQAVKERVNEIQKNLPEGIFINPIVDRSELIDRTSFTVFENLAIGFIIIFLVVLLILGNLRSALVISSIIPLSMLFTISLMYLFKIDVNLMSLGALDFGIIIDGAVIIVEFIAVSLTIKSTEIAKKIGSGRQKIMDKITFTGASKMMNSAIFGQLIILIVFIPILSLGDVEGKMFRPMALSFSFALLGAMFFGLTWLPAISSLVLKPVPEEKTFKVTRWIMKWIYRSFDPVIRWSYQYKRWVLSMGLASLILTGVVFLRMGGEFVPTLDEGDFVIQPVLKTGTSLSKTIELTTQMEQILIDKFPEVEMVVSRIGAAEVPTDPMSMEEIDMIIRLNPNKKEWTSASSKEELASHFKEALSVIPNVEYEFTQPIEMRFNELITGVRADLAVKIFGEDLEILNQKAIEAKSLIENIPGADDVVMEKTAGLPQMSVKYNRSKIAYYGLNIEDINNYVSMAFGGKAAGSVFEGERRFDLVARLQPNFRNDIEDIKNLYVAVPNGSQIPLSELAEISYTTGPAKISRDNTRRRVVVSVNVRNSDLQTVVEQIRPILNNNLNLPTGYYLEYGGQFENLDNASQRLKLAVPIALLLIFIFLHFAFNSIGKAALVFTAVPLSVVGGVMLLWIRGMPFSISAGVGFIALFGIAVLNGIVLIEHLDELKKEGVTDMKERVIRGTKERLRPVLLTASSTMMGFLPMAISTSAGAEVQRPLATVVIGGLITSTMLTMIALPLLYAIFENKQIGGIFKMLRPQNKKYLVFLLPLILAFSFSAHAQTSKLTSDEAVSIAIQNNTGLKAVEHYYQQQRALLPTSFNIEKTQIYYDYDENNIAENGYPLGVIGIEQSFEFPTVYFSQRQEARHGIDAAMKEFEQAQRNLQKNVELAFHKIQFLQKKLEKLKTIDSIYANYTKAAEQKFMAGDINKLDYLNAKSHHDQLKIQVKQTTNDIRIAHKEFNALLQADKEYSVVPEPITRLQLSPTATEETPGYQVLEQNIKQLKTAVKTEKNKLLPDISIGYYNGTNRYDNARNYVGVQVGLAFPIFFGNQKAHIDAAKQNQIATVFKQQDYRTRYNLKINTLGLELEKNAEQLQYYEDTGISLSEQIIETAQKSYQNGEIDFFRFVHFIENAINIEIEYINNLYKFNQTVIEINFLTIN